MLAAVDNDYNDKQNQLKWRHTRNSVYILYVILKSGQIALTPYVFSVAQQSSLLLCTDMYTYILFGYITYYCHCRVFVLLNR